MVVQINEEKTKNKVAWALSVLDRYPDRFEAARIISTYLGGHVDNGTTVLGFWTPELLSDNVDRSSIGIEIFTALDKINLKQHEQEIRFERTILTPQFAGEFLWIAVDGMIAGTRENIGSLYRGVYLKKDGSLHHFHDVVAYSMPFGMFAPVELYDIEHFHQHRSDRDAFLNLREGTTKNGRYKFTEPSNILEIHIGTASKEGTIAGLNRIFTTISKKISRDEELEAFEKNFVGYDAIQFMPIEPVMEPKHTQPYFEAESTLIDGEIDVHLRRPEITNWGYDINIHGSSAINPVLLESGRPDELTDLLQTLDQFAGGRIMAIWDLVFGHATNQGLELLNDQYFSGPNMYGQDMNFRHPIVRAILLEMQRRKTNWGATGLRIDGAQDFKYWDKVDEVLYHDDEYLQEMSDVVARAGEVEYYPWMIFEDGRPWPRDDWELASSYRSVIQDQPEVWQWGPLTFAHNTPFIFTFWLNKFWRVREIMEIGSHWLSGCSNHDTLRRGAQVNPENKVNVKLGSNLREIIQHAYNNEAQQLFFYIMAPGIPLDFLNANMEAPWLYFRNNDDHYGVKVVSEEYRFLDWWVTPDIYTEPDKFVRLKKLGFDRYAKLYSFMNDLVRVIAISDYHLTRMAKMLKEIYPYLVDRIFTKEGLKAFGWDFMDDMYELVNTSQYHPKQDEDKVTLNLQIREFRRAHPWLIEDLDYDRGEYFDYIHPSNSRAIYYGRRVSPVNHTSSVELVFVGNMEGTPYHFIPADLPLPDLEPDDWEVIFKAPSVEYIAFNQQLTLKNNEAIVFTRKMK